MPVHAHPVHGHLVHGHNVHGHAEHVHGLRAHTVRAHTAHTVCTKTYPGLVLHGEVECAPLHALYSTVEIQFHPAFDEETTTQIVRITA